MPVSSSRVKNLLANLVLALTLGLCVLCAFQWVREARLRARVAGLTQDGAKQEQVVVSLAGLVKKWEAEIARLDARVKELKVSEQTNLTAAATLQRHLRQAELEAEAQQKRATSFKAALEQANANLKLQNENISRQNAVAQEQRASLQQLIRERDDLVEKGNERTRQFNEVVAKYNALVKQIEQGQKAVK